MFSNGDRVRVVENPQRVDETIQAWLKGKVGTVVPGDPGYHDIVVQFDNTPRLGGMFALSEDDLKHIPADFYCVTFDLDGFKNYSVVMAHSAQEAKQKVSALYRAATGMVVYVSVRD